VSFVENAFSKGDLMNAKEVIRLDLTWSQQIMESLLSDLTDADLLVRPAPSANHIAWQLGHMIVSETRMGSQVPHAHFPELPAGFVERHSKETAAIEPPRGFASKAEYLNLFQKTRAATLAALDKLTPAALDQPNEGRMREFAPTIGALLLLPAGHTMMHAGQFSVVRRKLGKPVLF
jgi:hypothetical protein